MSAPEFQRALSLAEIPRGQMRTCVLGAREIVICHTRDGLFALDNICSHAHARMNEGRLKGLKLICPLHGASFDVRDGTVLGGPATQPLPHYGVRVAGGIIEVTFDPPR